MLRPLVLAVALIALPAAAQPQPQKAAPAPRPVTVRPAAEQCRAACARDYYFCLSQDEPELCAPAWAQCRNRCGSAL